MKILFIGDYSNLHACLAAELRRRGHEVTVMSDGCGHMKTRADIYIERKPGIAGGMRYLYRLFSLLPSLKGYDVVQLINSNFLSLRPGKIKYFFDALKGENGSMFLTLAGNDYYFVKACAQGEIFRFSEFMAGDKPTEFHRMNPSRLYGWISEANRRWSEYLYEKIDGAMSVLPEYDMAARGVLGERLHFTNLPVDLASLPWTELDTEGPLRLFVGIRGGMELQKGTGRLLEIARKLEREMPGKVTAQCARDLTLTEYLRLMRQSHVVLDQLYSYSPATNALQAMALGRVAASGAQPEYYSYIGDPEERPVISLSPLDGDIEERLRAFAADPEPLREMGRQGRRLVERHNDVRIVADRFLDVWNQR